MRFESLLDHPRRSVPKHELSERDVGDPRDLQSSFWDSLSSVKIKVDTSLSLTLASFEAEVSLGIC